MEQVNSLLRFPRKPKNQVSKPAAEEVKGHVVQPVSDQFLESLQVKGGPVYPLEKFKMVYDTLFEGFHHDISSKSKSEGEFLESNPIAKLISSKFANQRSLSTKAGHAGGGKAAHHRKVLKVSATSLSKGKDNMKEDQGLGHISICDDAFASYLIYLSQRVNLGFYVRAVKVILLYRDFLNQLGIRKSVFKQNVLGCESLLQNLSDWSVNVQRNLNDEKEFCSTQKAKNIPKYCNEFILSYCVYYQDKLWMPRR